MDSITIFRLQFNYNFKEATPDMQWMPLKLDLLPAISIETERTIELYHELGKKVANGQHREQTKYAELKNQMQKRIDQLDQFYDQHCQDQRVALFHRLKLQMMKTLIEPNESVRHEQPIRTVENAVSKSPISRESSKPTATMDSTISLSQSSQPAKHIRTRQNASTTASQRKIKPSTNTSAAEFKELNRQIKKVQHQPRPPTKEVKPQLYPTVKEKQPVVETKKPTPLPEFKKPDNPKPSKSRLQTVEDQLDSIVAMPPHPSQIVFTIKMTKEEYLQFLSAKQTRK